MKNNKRKQSNPTLTELLDPYLRNPPSPPPQQPPQSPAPPSLPSSSLPTVQRDLARPRRLAPQFYQVHPRDFRALVQRLTGSNASATNNNRPPTVEERQVENIHNVPGIEEESELRDKSDSDCCTPATLSARTMEYMGDFSSEKNIGESSNMGSPSSHE